MTKLTKVLEGNRHNNGRKSKLKDFYPELIPEIMKKIKVENVKIPNKNKFLGGIALELF